MFKEEVPNRKKTPNRLKLSNKGSACASTNNLDLLEPKSSANVNHVLKLSDQKL